MKTIFMDIETLPADDRQWAAIENGIREDIASSYKKTDTIKQKQEEAFQKTSLSAEFGRILCIGVVIDENGMESRAVLGWDDKSERFTLDESSTLKNWWGLLTNFDPSSDLIVGHNLFQFDLKFIFQRSVIHKIRPSVDLSFRRYQNRPIFDTMQEWTNWSTQLVDKISLDRLAM